MSTEPPKLPGHDAPEANDDKEVRDPRLKSKSLSDGISHELNSPLQILTDSFRLLIEMNRTMINLISKLSHKKR